MMTAMLAWSLIAGGCIVGLYVLLLKSHTVRAWDAQSLAALYFASMLLSLYFLVSAWAGTPLFSAPYVPALTLLAWLFLTVTYVPVRITRTVQRYRLFPWLKPGALFIASVFFSLLLALLFFVFFLIAPPLFSGPV